MKIFVLLLVVGISRADPAYYYAPGYGYQADYAAIDYANIQHHAQDGLGQYSYGYSNPTSGKSEVKTADGVTRGSYSYVDANGVLQSVHYISDPVNGFRVSATNLPQAPGVEQPAVETPVYHYAPSYQYTAPVVTHPVPVSVPAAAPEVVPEVKSEELVDLHTAEPVLYHAAPVVAPQVVAQQVVAPYVAAPVAAPVASPVVAPVAAPVVAPVAAPVAAPEVAAVPVAPIAAPVISKYHAQDEFGQYQFGYAEQFANRAESRDANGVVTGSYNYIDQNGQSQTVNYIADGLGFRVAGTTIQGHNVAPVQDTPEVAAAKAAHLKAFAEIKASHLADNLVEEAEPIVVEEPAAPVVDLGAEPIVETLGQYRYGYATADSSKNEQRTADGIVSGDYSYVDANGVLQQVQYVSDELGFRVAATNLPIAPQPAPYVAPVAPVAPQVVQQVAPQVVQQVAPQQVVAYQAPEVAQQVVQQVAPQVVQQVVPQVVQQVAPQVVAYQAPEVAPQVVQQVVPQVVQQVAPQVVAYQAPEVAPQVVQQVVPQVVQQVAPQVVAQPQQVLQYAPHYGYNVPVVSSNVPVHATQFHAQDEAGNYNYGYANPNSAKSETKGPDGITRGTYSYVDANGELQIVNYISDALGFRVAATNLPKAPVPVEAAHPVVNTVEEQPALDIRTSA